MTVPKGLEGRDEARTDRGFYVLVVACFAGILVCLPLQAATPSFILALASIGLLAMQDLRGILILAYPVYALLGALFSGVLIEHGAYITEEFRYGENIGATPLLAAYTVGFVGIAHFSLRLFLGARLSNSADVNLSWLRKLTLAICVGAGMFYLAAFALIGTGFAYPDLRFGWSRALPPGFGVIHNLLAALFIPTAFALAAFDVVVSRKISRSFFVLVVPLAAMYFIGSKFSEFNTPVMFGFMGAGLGGYVSGRRAKVKLRHVLIALAVVGGLTLSIFVGLQKLGNVNLYDSFVTRVALQGHVWWGIVDNFQGAPRVPFSSLVAANTSDKPSGLDLLSYVVSRPDFVRQRISLGYHFTMGGPPGVLGVMGSYAGLVVFTLMGLAYGAVAYVIVEAIKFARPVATVAALIVFLQYGYATLGGSWDDLHGKVSLACYVMLALSFLTSRNWSARSDRRVTSVAPAPSPRVGTVRETSR